MSAQLLTNDIRTAGNRAETKNTISQDADNKSSSFSILFVILLAGVCIFGTWKLLDPATLPVKHVRVQGQFQYLSESKMQSLVSDVVRGGFFNLNVKAIQEVLLTDPWVNWVTVKRVWPDGIRVHVKEQTATSHWNENSLLNAESEIFTPDNANELVGIPYLSGPVGTEKQVAERFREVQQALQPYSMQVLNIDLSDRRSWRIQIINGPLVILGRKDIDKRFDRFVQSALTSMGKEIENVQQVDMRYTNGFAVQWKNNSSYLNESGLTNNG